MKNLLLVVLFASFSLSLSAQGTDISLSEIILPNGNYSVLENNVFPYVVIENVGDLTITNVNVYYQIDDFEIVLRNVSPIQLEAGQTRNVLFAEIELPLGNHEFTAWVELVEEVEDLNMENDTLSSEFTVFGGDIAIVDIVSPQDNYCGLDSLSPSVWVKNVGEIDVNSFIIRYRLDMDPMVDLNWEGYLPVGDSILISFPLINPGSGNHSIQFFALDPNGAPDSMLDNNTMGMDFTFTLGMHVSVEIETDWDAVENSFVIYNSADEIIASEDGFTDQNNYLFNYCLVPGCYTFIIYDAGGDGMCHTFMPGYYNIVNEDSGENIASGCDFGSQELIEFCIDPPDGPPLPFFSFNVVNQCSGEVQFNDMSSSSVSITNYLWDFGDGTTSNEQNPYHYYNANGNYNVSLTATNQFGTETYTIYNAVTIDMPDAPEVFDGFSCGQGDVTISAQSSGGELNWYVDMSSETPVFTGTEHTFDDLSETTIWYVQESTAPNVQNFGLSDNSGVGGYFSWNIWRSVFFEAYQDVTIKSIKVFAQGPGPRTFYLENDAGVLIEEITFDLPNGESIIEVNMQLAQGSYSLSVNTQNKLSYNGDYSGPNMGYPFLIDDLIAITGNNYSDSFYYFFYDIEVYQGFNEYCLTPKVPVTAYVQYPEPTFSDVSNCCIGQDCMLDAGEEYVSYLWSTDETEQMIEADAGTYSVSVTDGFGCTGEGSTEVVLNSEGSISLNISHVNNIEENNGAVEAIMSEGTPPYNYAWSNGETTQSISNLEPGVYTVTVIDAGGCTYIETANVLLQVGINPIEKQLKIYPNPVSNLLNIEWEGNTFDVKVYNTLGELIYFNENEINTLVLDLSSYPQGVYFLKLNTDKFDVVRRLIKQ